MQTTPHLTAGNPAFIDRVHATHEGQASWAEGTNTCRECVFWGYADEPFRRHRAKLGSGRLKNRSCVKFQELTGKEGPGVPHDARACRFFERDPDALSVTGK